MAGNASDMILQTAGGRIPFNVLRRVAELAMVHGNGQILLGARQELILCAVPPSGRDRIRRDIGGLLTEFHPRRPNIVTTRPTAGRAGRTPWLSDGTYEAILAQFVTRPAFPVCLSDPRQDQMPLQFGQIHFVASAEPSFWQASFIPHGQLRPVVLSTAIHSEGIAAAAFVIQHQILRDNAASLPELQRTLEECLGGLARELAPAARPQATALDPIVGFRPDGAGDTVTLGIPALGQSLPGAFLVDLCVAARAASLATGGLTPWQSLLVPGLPPAARETIERLLVQHRISTHNGGWDGAFLSDVALPLHQAAAASLLVTLNRIVPHPGPLQVGFTAHGATLPDTPILVRAEYDASRWPFRPEARYNVYFRENFDRFSPMVVPVASGARAPAMNAAVLQCVGRYASGAAAPSATEPDEVEAPVRRHAGVPLHRCMECQTEYSEQYGDPLGGIDAGTPFAELPADWKCPTCGAPLSKFITTREFAA